MDQLLARAAVLLANPSFFEGMKNQFGPSRRRLEPDHLVIAISIIGLGVFGFWVLSRILALQEQRKPFYGPKRLFLELCRGHGLGWVETWSLWCAARWQRLENPAQMFLDPRCFDPGKLGPSLYNSVEPIRRKIFGDLSALAGEPETDQPPDDVTAEEPAPVADGDRPADGAAPSGVPLFPSPERPSLDVPPWAADEPFKKGFPLSLLDNVGPKQRRP